MSIEITIAPNAPKAVASFPLLRMHSDVAGKYGPLVVLFVDTEKGVALSGVDPSRIGKGESWLHFADALWTPVTVVLRTED